MGLRQVDVARRAGTSQSIVTRLERGFVDRAPLATVLAVASALEVRLDLVARWRGGDLPRLLNAGHAALHVLVARLLDRYPGWSRAAEVTFAVYGERGVIDVLAFHAGRRALLVIELKTTLVDVHELLSAVDRYRRLARRVAAERGWRATHVSAWVVMSATDTNRRRVAAHAAVVRAAFPDDGRDMRTWLRDPVGVRSALSYHADSRARTTSAERSGVRRVRRPSASVDRAARDGRQALDRR